MIFADIVGYDNAERNVKASLKIMYKLLVYSAKLTNHQKTLLYDYATTKHIK